MNYTLVNDRKNGRLGGAKISNMHGEMLDAFQTWQRKIGDPFANPDHVSFLLDEQQKNLGGNYRVNKKADGDTRPIR